MSSFKLGERADQVQAGEEISSDFLVSSDDGSKVLDCIEEAFDEVAVLFCFTIAELILAFVCSAGSVGEGWAEISVILTHVVTFLAAI